LVYKTPDSGDDGVDVVAITGSEGYLVQAKSTLNTEKGVSWDAIKDVVTGKASYKRRHPGVEFKLFCITNQHFNSNAKEQAQMNNVQLIDRDNIKNFLTEYQIRRSDIDKHLFTNWNQTYDMAIESTVE
jgi:HJR/Mrr/RecB family endonuclease